MSRVLIVHADDFNLTPGVSQGILKGFLEGIVRSTSVMVNLPRIEAAAELLRNQPGLDVGVHLNLTQGHTVSRPEDVPTLVDDTGRLRKRQALDPAALNPAEVQTELLAQVRRLMDLGVRVSHVDTHHHMHDNPKIFPVVQDVASELHLSVRSYGPDMRASLSQRGLNGPDHLITEFYGAEAVTEEFLLDVIRGLKPGVSELCCHPAQVDDDLRNISSYTEPRQRELAILCSPRIRAALEEGGIRLAGYADAFA